MGCGEVRQGPPVFQPPTEPARGRGRSTAPPSGRRVARRYRFLNALIPDGRLCFGWRRRVLGVAEEVGEGDAHGGGEAVHGVEGEVATATLDVGDVGAVQLGAQ